MQRQPEQQEQASSLQELLLCDLPYSLPSPGVEGCGCQVDWSVPGKLLYQDAVSMIVKSGHPLLTIFSFPVQAGRKTENA